LLLCIQLVILNQQALSARASVLVSPALAVSASVPVISGLPVLRIAVSLLAVPLLPAAPSYHMSIFMNMNVDDVLAIVPGH
jgi:hypothetical protein